MYYETPDYILSRQSYIDAETELVMRSRLQNYSSWQHPGMIVRPGLEKFIDDMVSFDPLYIVDQHYDLLKPAMNQYPEEYQRRLRTYVVTERIDRDMLDKIPNNQFGICFVYNYFNFRPFEFIKKYIEEIYQKLKPGGVLIMTFNDCDRAKAVMLVEQHYACYTPGNLLQNMAHRVGFETIFTWHNNGPTTWLELRKPGTLTSLRGGQTLAKIVHKSVAESK
jgi:SAM-dependent methyltransferase